MKSVSPLVLLKSFLLVIVLLGVATMKAEAKISPQDRAKIESTVNSFSVLADQNAYQFLGRILAPQVTLDYRSIFGGEVSTVSNKELMQQWSNFLPGFDTTFHRLINFNIQDAGNHSDEQVIVDVEFNAKHWLGDKGYWEVFGNYQFTLIKNQQDWRISAIKVDSKGERGSREALEKAPALAKQKLAERNAKLLDF